MPRVPVEFKSQLSRETLDPVTYTNRLLRYLNEILASPSLVRRLVWPSQLGVGERRRRRFKAVLDIAGEVGIRARHGQRRDGKLARVRSAAVGSGSVAAAAVGMA
ncbi:hypothetical protein NL676_007352 [Syzygium grande]|nr:hypothetical protein NL676_007352 [Syzygium grande]